MLSSLFHHWTRRRQRRFMRKAEAWVRQIQALEPHMQSLSNEELKGQTDRFKHRLHRGETLDDLLVEAFATVREASRRVLGKRHFDVQLKGGMVLHQGAIAEMRTGEGKTLVATLPVYLNALAGRGVHVVTVNDYLAKRDAEEMGQLYGFLGLTTGCILQEGWMSDEEKRAAYRADITYGTNNQFGFDYLKDNMAPRVDADPFGKGNSLETTGFPEKIQRPLHFALIDEVDSILIDEGRTPLIISGPSDDVSDLYVQANRCVQNLTTEDYEIETKSKSISFREAGWRRMEHLAEEAGLLQGRGLFSYENAAFVHHLNQALKANYVFRKDVDYLVRRDKVLIIDEFTGRVLDGRRYSDGLHQALEAKEGVEIEPESQTLASITFQNYFRLYNKVSAMTGTAKEDEKEFEEVYQLMVYEIPTHQPIRRIDEEDEVYRTFPEKVRAVTRLVKECFERKQPVLLGTISVEKSDLFSQALHAAGIPHQVLNARQNENEAKLIAHAGNPGSVIVATNMAGRGTDIQLGGNLAFELNEALAEIEDEEEKQRLEADIRQAHAQRAAIARAAGGLFVIGTERHESRRIDNQLRGRTGRQGDPGKSKFFLSLQDDLMKIFGSQALDAWLMRLGIQEDEVITHPWVTKAIAKAQKKVEAYNFDLRKQVLKYDDVANAQRKIVYARRQIICTDPHWQETLVSLAKDYVDSFFQSQKISKKTASHVLFNSAIQMLEDKGCPPFHLQKIEENHPRRFLSLVEEHVIRSMGYHETLSPETLLQDKKVALHLFDRLWKEHLQKLDHLRQGVHLLAYGQKDPLNEYKTASFRLFQNLLGTWQEEVIWTLIRHAQNPESKSLPEEEEEDTRSLEDMQSQLDALLAEWKALRTHEDQDAQSKPGDADAFETASLLEQNTSHQINTSPLGRNQACACGSQKRYKHCCGLLVV